MISKEIFTPMFKSLGYELVITKQEDLDILQKYGGITFHRGNKNAPEHVSSTICSCGVKYPYTVNTCYLCSNTKFKKQTSFNRRNNRDVFSDNLSNYIEKTEEETKDNVLDVIYCEIAIVKNFFNFETNEYDFNISNIVKFYVKTYSGEENKTYFAYFKEDRKTPYILPSLGKNLNLDNYNLKRLVHDLVYIHKDKLSASFIEIDNNEKDRFMQKLPSELQKLFSRSLERFFINGEHLYATSSYTHYNEKLYAMDKVEHQFFKLPKFLYDLFIQKEVDNYKTSGYYNSFSLFNQFNIAKLQKTGDFYTEDLFTKYPLLNQFSASNLFRIYELVHHKKKPHEFLELIEYILEIKDFELIEDINDVVLYYHTYMKKSKEFKMYVNNLTVEYQKL